MIFSFVADNYGRKIALSLAWAMTTVGSLLLAVIQLSNFSVLLTILWLQ